MDSKLIKEKGLCYVIRDISANLNCCEIAFCLVIGVISSLIILLFPKVDNWSSLFGNDILNIFPGLAGFTLTCYTIVFTLGDKPIFKEKMHGKTVYSVLCSTFIFTILMQLLTIVMACCLKYLKFGDYISSLLLFVLTVLSIFSIALVFNIILHIFSIRTLLLR